jgi:pimeloyl-ACP methyl ester carboxylesterase
MTACPAYDIRGSTGPVMLFLHGMGGDRNNFDPQIDHFAAHYRAVAWDAPGFGRSRPWDDLSFAAMADAGAALLDRVETDTAIIVGHSMGGMIALELAARHSDRLRALVLSGTSPAFGDPNGPWQQQFVRESLAPVENGNRLTDHADALIRNVIGSDADPAGVQLAIDSMARTPHDSYRKVLHNLIEFDRRDVLPRITVPTLVIAGAEDTKSPPAMLERMAAKIPGARFVSLPRAGHLANLEQPGAYNAAIERFLTMIGLPDNL